MFNTVKCSPAPIPLEIRLFLGACIFCLGIHFLVNDLAIFNLDALIRHLPGKTASFRIADNDHQEDQFLRSGPTSAGHSLGLTLPGFSQPFYPLSRSISPLFSPPKI